MFDSAPAAQRAASAWIARAVFGAATLTVILSSSVPGAAAPGLVLISVEQAVAGAPTELAKSPVDRRLETIAAAHGIRPLQTWLPFSQATDGAQIMRIVLWQIPDGAAVERLRQDEHYRAYVERSAALVARSWLLAKQRLGSARADAAPVAAVELVVPNPGYGLREHDAYDAALARVAARHAVIRRDSYVVLAGVSGSLASAIEMDLWALPDASALARLHGDPEFVALAGERARIHDIHASHTVIVQPDR